jgi:hypothetical protein
MWSLPKKETAGQRRRMGIEPTSDGCRRSPVLKTGAPTRNAYASPAGRRRPSRDCTQPAPFADRRNATAGPPAAARQRSHLPAHPGGR